jgi:hypothetical protein
MPLWGCFFNIVGVIKSMPRTFFECKRPISALISFGDTGFMGVIG